ncbi:MAG: Bor family protein [Odoribacter sp.]
MKKVLLLAVCVISMCSCYNTRILVGDVKPKDPVVEINSEWNHHLIAGLVPLGNAKMNPEEYLAGHKNYVVKTNMNFLNMLVGFVTFGIYTPTNTVYYIPLKDMGNK